MGLLKLCFKVSPPVAGLGAVLRGDHGDGDLFTLGISSHAAYCQSHNQNQQHCNELLHFHHTLFSSNIILVQSQKFINLLNGGFCLCTPLLYIVSRRCQQKISSCSSVFVKSINTSVPFRCLISIFLLRIAPMDFIFCNPFFKTNFKIIIFNSFHPRNSIRLETRFFTGRAAW